VGARLDADRLHRPPAPAPEQDGVQGRRRRRRNSREIESHAEGPRRQGSRTPPSCRRSPRTAPDFTAICPANTYSPASRNASIPLVPRWSLPP
jgi:hypothetical protein